MPFFVYILQSAKDGRFYVGQTEHIAERVKYHNAGYSHALRNRGPWRLVHSEAYPTRADALRRERYIKKQESRAFILQLLSASR